MLEKNNKDSYKTLEVLLKTYPSLTFYYELKSFSFCLKREETAIFREVCGTDPNSQINES